MAVSKRRQILDATAATSDVFRVSPGGQYQLIVTEHAGGTWQLECRISKDHDWISVGSDGEFSADGIKSMFLNSECEWRLSGGTMGAEAYLIPINGGQGVVTDG